MTDSPSHRPSPPAARTLLIVDDEPDLAPMFRRFLKRHFAEIFEATGAAQASEILAAKPMTHLIVDASLPDCESGQSMAEQWRSQFPSIRYVALFSGSASLRDARLPGVDRVFIKPEGFDELIAALKA
ncbi:MAG TPA: response regulator [Myxococcales bacterium]